MEEKKNWFNYYASLMEQNIRGVQYGVYGIATLGLCIALRSVRPFLKFHSPSDIPQHFIDKKMSFIGQVLRVEPCGHTSKNPILLVDHVPLIALLSKNESGLPIEVSSVDISSNGLSWMQSLLVNSQIKFTPLHKNSETVQCIVYLKKQNVGQHLVSLGFASVSGLDFKLEKDPVYLKYYKSLLSAESKAEKKGLGMWAGERISWKSYLFNMSKIRRFGIT